MEPAGRDGPPQPPATAGGSLEVRAWSAEPDGPAATETSSPGNGTGGDQATPDRQDRAPGHPLAPGNGQHPDPGQSSGQVPLPPGGPARRGQLTGRVTSRLRRVAALRVTTHTAVLLSFVVAGMVVTSPRPWYLVEGKVPASRDSASYVWGFWWFTRQLTHAGNPWFTTHMAAPAGVSLGFHTLMPLPALLLTPLTLTAGPGASYNLLVAVMPGLLCYAMYRVARLWLRSATGAIAAGAFYGLSSMLAQQDWYHVNIAAGALFLPMALEASVRLRRRPGVRQAAGLGLVMGAAVLTDQESAVLAAIATGLALVPWLARHPSWAKLRPALLATAIGTALASPQIIVMVQEIIGARGGLAIPMSLLAVSYKQYGIGLPGMFTPSPRVSDFGLPALASPFLHGRDNEGLPMFGTVLTVAALAGLVAARRRLSAWLLAGLWLGCAALALGTSLWIGKHQYLPLASMWHGVWVSDIMPYTWFVRIPGLSSFREADRLAILGLLPAALLAGAAVDWLRYHARPAIALVVILGLAEAGYSGDPRVSTMPVSYPALDQAIAADHSGSIVVDVPFGMRGGIPVNGVPFFPQALVMATQDGHPRAISYTSRLPYNTIAAINAHPFYRYLIQVQHEVPHTCPWRMTGQADALLLCQHPYGVAASSPGELAPGQLAAAGRDAAGMHIGWAVIWKRNISVDGFVLPYLRATGFQYAYRDHGWLVFRRAAGKS